MFRSSYCKKNVDASYVSPPFKSGCGEIITFFITIDNEHIRLLTFTTSASQLTMKALDVLCAYAINKTVSDIMQLSTDAFIQLINLPVTGKRAQEAAAPLILLQEWITLCHDS